MNLLNKIYNENCLTTISNIKSPIVDLVLTSPPYDDLRTYGGGYSFDFEPIARELTRILKPGGVIVWVVGDATIGGSETCTSFKQVLYFREKCKLDLYDTMIYQKTGTPFPSTCRYNQCFEYMFVFSKGKPNTFNPILKINKTAGAIRHSRKFRQANGDMVPAFNGKSINKMGIENNIWLIRNGMFKSSKDKIAFKHPAIFPEELAEKHIKTWTNKDDVVYDPFSGSGTVAKICIMHDRKWFGSELNKEYCDIANERIKNVEEIKEITIHNEKIGYSIFVGEEQF